MTVPTHIAQQALAALGKWSSGRDMDAVELNDLIATLEAALEQPEQEPEPVAWKVRMICCGRDDGVVQFQTWEEADEFRQNYTSGPGVHPNGCSGCSSEAAIARSMIAARLWSPECSGALVPARAGYRRRKMIDATAYLAEAEKQVKKQSKRQVSERTVRNTIAQVRVFARAVPINPTLLMAADQMENMLAELIERRKK